MCSISLIDKMMIKRFLLYLPPFWLILFFSVTELHAQTCTASFTATSVGPNTFVFTSNSVPTTSTSQYSWNFGDGSNVAYTPSPSVGHSYSVSGTYTVTLWFWPFTPGNDSCQATLVINTTPQPTCNLVLDAKPSSPAAACNGEAYITQITGLCGPGTATWSNGATTPSIGNLCPGIYTVQVGTTFTGNCCPLLTGTIAVIGQNCPADDLINHYPGNQGNVYFWHTSSITNTNSVYQWDFGDGAAIVSGTALFQAQHSYSVNGNYPVTCTVVTPPSSCTLVTKKTVNVSGSNIFPCQLVPALSFTVGSNGQVFFLNQSSGSVPSTKFVWNWGDQSATYNGLYAIHQYSNNGIYTVTLNADNLWTPACAASTVAQISITNTSCFLAAAFNYTLGAGGLVNFSAQTGSLSSVIWSFGDDSTATGPLVTHTYSTNGIKSVVLKEFQNQCYAASVQNISVSSAPCVLTAGFTHTVLNGGLVKFSNASTGISSSTRFRWNFGNGMGSLKKDPDCVFSGNGVYYVSLLVFDSLRPDCRDSIKMAINVTGMKCEAISYFKVFPGKTAGMWNLMPADPWNVVSAQWDWGDGTSSYQLYASHLYTLSGTYEVCLSVTVACGATSKTCLKLTFSGHSGGNNWQAVNIVAPELITALETNGALSGIQVYPNPSAGLFFIHFDKAAHRRVLVYDLSGNLVRDQVTNVPADDIIVELDIPGIYILKVISEKTTVHKKLIVESAFR